ncbi:Copper amine oxidase N-terminal domain-containing protein [Carboxydocella thermautotrophica]|nr:Copper amine oxidase N-terminal domain-containing protein [Carboxydocella thermautotrophica]
MKKVLISFLFVVFLLPATLVWAWEDHIILGRTYDGEVDTTHTIPGYSLEQMLKFLYYEASNVEEILAIDGVPISKTPWKKYGGKINPKVKKPDPIDTMPRPINVAFSNGLFVYFPDQRPVFYKNRVMVPLRAFAEALSANVSWNQQDQSIKIQKDNTMIVFKINSNIMLINGIEKKMDISPYILNKRTMTPVRYICEAFGYQVSWDNNAKMVLVNVDVDFVPGGYGNEQ